MDLRNGNCLELMKTLDDNSVDLLICDLPYGETNCKWDIKIDMVQFWKEFKRIRKSKRTACIHFCSTRFGYELIKSWEKGYKMDMVWKKRNKTGGLQSRHRPMRNHEMVYFFYEQAPKYNRDKYHKRIQTSAIDKKGGKNGHGFDNNIESGLGRKSNNFDPPNPVSVVEEEPKYTQEYLDNKQKTPGTGGSEVNKIFTKQNRAKWKKENGGFEPPNPASVIEEEPKYTQEFLDNKKNGAGVNNPATIYTKENQKRYLKENGGFEPPNPASVIEEGCSGKEFGWKTHKLDKNNRGKEGFEPKLPVSIVEEQTDIYGETKSKRKLRVKKDAKFKPPNPGSVLVLNEEKSIYGKTKKQQAESSDGFCTNHYEPPNPSSVVEEEEEPVSMFESTKVFIGKRHHQTEKPQDILEFFLKYWTDEDDVVLDPTMGSGSTGVACKKMGRKFIGFELSPEIYDKACVRVGE